MAAYDFIIVGAGFAGSILAERLASENGKKILLIEQRDHIAGNMYDYVDEHGVVIHKYGPHLFRTNSPRVLHSHLAIYWLAPIPASGLASVKDHWSRCRST